jgi:hypothetical protein
MYVFVILDLIQDPWIPALPRRQAGFAGMTGLNPYFLAILNFRSIY